MVWIRILAEHFLEKNAAAGIRTRTTASLRLAWQGRILAIILQPHMWIIELKKWAQPGSNR